MLSKRHRVSWQAWPEPRDPARSRIFNRTGELATLPHALSVCDSSDNPIRDLGAHAISHGLSTRQSNPSPYVTQAEPQAMFAEMRPRIGGTADRLTAAVDRLSATLSRDRNDADAFVSNMMRISDAVWLVRLDAGSDRGSIGTVIQEGRRLSTTRIQEFAENNGRINARWADIEDYAAQSGVPPQLQAAITRAGTPISSSSAPCAQKPSRTWRRANSFPYPGMTG